MQDTSSLPIAFQGEPGAYSEAAALEHFGPDAPTLPCPSFDAVFDAVENGQAAAGLIAIENSLAGSIHQNYDLLQQRSLAITGEHLLRVRHCLIAMPGQTLQGLHSVISHPQALAQCAGYLRQRGLAAEAFYDTAGAVKHLAEGRLENTAATRAAGGTGVARPTGAARQTGAIASRRAAEVYEMQVLDEGIEDNPANFTRFLVIAAATEPLEPAAGIRAEYKTSIVFRLANQPGALFKALSVFALRDIDLTRIESRPLVGSPWEYLFYVDFVGAAADGPARRALDHLGEYAASLRVLGSYPRYQA
jgi:prephenate dehydratase